MLSYFGYTVILTSALHLRQNSLVFNGDSLLAPNSAALIIAEIMAHPSVRARFSPVSLGSRSLTVTIIGGPIPRSNSVGEFRVSTRHIAVDYTDLGK